MLGFPRHCLHVSKGSSYQTAIIPKSKAAHVAPLSFWLTIKSSLRFPHRAPFLLTQVSKTSRSGGYSVDPELRKKIQAFNWADTVLYEKLNATLWYRVAHAVGFQEELERLQVSLTAACCPWTIVPAVCR